MVKNHQILILTFPRTLQTSCPIILSPLQTLCYAANVCEQCPWPHRNISPQTYFIMKQHTG